MDPRRLPVDWPPLAPRANPVSIRHPCTTALQRRLPAKKPARRSTGTRHPRWPGEVKTIVPRRPARLHKLPERLSISAIAAPKGEFTPMPSPSHRASCPVANVSGGGRGPVFLPSAKPGIQMDAGSHLRLIYLDNGIRCARARRIRCGPGSVCPSRGKTGSTHQHRTRPFAHESASARFDNAFPDHGNLGASESTANTQQLDGNASPHRHALHLCPRQTPALVAGR